MKIYLVLFHDEIDIISRDKDKVIKFILANTFYTHWMNQYNKTPKDLITEYEI